MNIYVGNLSYKVRESDLKEVIEEYEWAALKEMKPLSIADATHFKSS